MTIYLLIKGKKFKNVRNCFNFEADFWAKMEAILKRTFFSSKLSDGNLSSFYNICQSVFCVCQGVVVIQQNKLLFFVGSEFLVATSAKKCHLTNVFFIWFVVSGESKKNSSTCGAKWQTLLTAANPPSWNNLLPLLFVWSAHQFSLGSVL